MFTTKLWEPAIFKIMCTTQNCVYQSACELCVSRDYNNQHCGEGGGGSSGVQRAKRPVNNQIHQMCGVKEVLSFAGSPV